MDKLKELYRLNKKALLCIFIITIIGIIAGSIFYFMISTSDKQLVVDSISNFFNNIINNQINYTSGLKNNLIINLLYIFFIWLLGVSLIGIPLILVLYFFKTFTLGFTLVSIIANYGVKGIIYSFVYLFPHNIINVLALSVLSIYAIICSFNTLSGFFKKEVIDYRNIIIRYRYILVTTSLIMIMTSLYQSFIMPLILKIVLNLIK